MRKKLLACVLLLAVGSLFTQTQERREEFPTYAEMRRHFSVLYQQKKLKEAADLLEWAITEFPDHLKANAFNLAIVYAQLDKSDQGIKILKYALERGIWFDTISFSQEIWAPLKENKEFKEFFTRSEERKQEARRTPSRRFLC